ncbi:carbohydrate binding family 9 domain-containing protein [Massilia sp. TS11]|uniref:carbohydrate binding family 9 domain-containing protein n=1 Tax=Massilia sp. TS11 TaxID=2908003 RepID=UPI001EDC8B9B|nr:DUF5916 domain-containing protein [Massilia sp. TS11]MCG2585389.1 carbohydrate binding family 9 domain-containing protein [Massilia sp. TS11]
MKRLLLAALLAATFAAPARADLQAYHVTQRVQMDGRLSDPVWAKATVHDQFYQNLPQDKVPAIYKTEIRLLYDAHNLYIGMRAFDPDPTRIRAPYARRDKTFADQDLFIVFLDPTGSRKSAQFIRVNPQGSVSDGVFSDLSGEDFSPDFDFEVMTGRFDGGWSAEIRIPFSALAYDDPARTPWNLLAFRSMPREERYRMTNTALPKDSNCFLCYAEPIRGMRDLPTGLNWSATPQIRTQSARDEENGVRGPRRHKTDLSLDLKLRLDPATTIDTTINPDFSQVELDAPQLSGNTTYGLFFQEKRPFFLEGADMISTLQKAIYTRAITDPAWGVRYTRRSNGADATILSVRDNGGGLVQLPGPYATNYALQDFRSQATVARADLRFGQASAGAVFSDRTLADGRGYNRVLGPDFSWNEGDSLRLRGQLLASDTTALPDRDGRLVEQRAVRGHAWMLEGETNSDDWSSFASLQNVSRGFRDDNGFFFQAGYRDLQGELRRKFGQVGPFHTFNLYAFGGEQIDPRGDTILASRGLGVWMQGPYDLIFNVQLHPAEKQRVREGGQLLGRDKLRLEWEISPSAWLPKVVGNLELGDVVDVDAERVGRGGTLSLTPRFRPTPRLELEPSINLSQFSGPQRRAYREQALALNGIYHLSGRDTLRLIWQHRHTERDQAQYRQPITPDSRSSITSLVYAHTRGLGTALYVGATISDSREQAARYGLRQNELFIKASWQI